MRRIRVRAAIALLAMAAAALPGCGDGEDKASERADSDFRIPDSLLAPIEGYNLTVDDYHPIDGGRMVGEDIILLYPASSLEKYTGVISFGYALDAYKTVTEKIGRPAEGKIVMVGTTDLDEYKFLTRKEWWYYGVIQADTIIFEPYDIMMKRYDTTTKKNIEQIGMCQKIAQMALDRISGGRIPIWLRESMASHVADEWPILNIQAIEFRKELVGYKPSVEEVEKYLEEARERAYTRVAFFVSYIMLRDLLESHSWEDLMAFVRDLGVGSTLDEASSRAFGTDYQGLLDEIGLEEDFTAYIEEVQMPERKERHKTGG